MSQAVAVESLPERTVRSRSQYARTLHRPDPDSTHPTPACDVRGSGSEWTDVPTVSHRPHYKLCGNPECFGGERR